MHSSSLGYIIVDDAGFNNMDKFRSANLYTYLVSFCMQCNLFRITVNTSFNSIDHQSGNTHNTTIMNYLSFTIFAFFPSLAPTPERQICIQEIILNILDVISEILLHSSNVYKFIR